MLMNLAEKGIVNLDDPVSKYYNKQAQPEFKPVNPYGSKTHQSVTLRSLATHTSGLAREPICGILETCKEDIIFNGINSLPLFTKPLTTPRYSNLGSALLAHCLERGYSTAAGKDVTYEEWLDENVFSKIGMSSTGFNYTDSVKKKMSYGCKKNNNNNNNNNTLLL